MFVNNNDNQVNSWDFYILLFWSFCLSFFDSRHKNSAHRRGIGTENKWKSECASKIQKIGGKSRNASNAADIKPIKSFKNLIYFKLNC